MKKNIILFPVLILLAIFLSSCEGDLNNNFTFKNISDSNLSVNFRARIFEVPKGKTITIKDVPKGTYSFATTYELPAGAVSSTVQGNASGSVIFNLSTKVLVLYSSTITEDGAYTLFATLTTSDDLTDDNPSGP